MPYSVYPNPRGVGGRERGMSPRRAARWYRRHPLDGKAARYPVRGGQSAHAHEWTLFERVKPPEGKISEVIWGKLEALAQGAAIASRRFWRWGDIIALGRSSSVACWNN